MQRAAGPAVTKANGPPAGDKTPPGGSSVLLAPTYPGQVSDETPQAGDLLVRIGAIMFLVGAAATLATVAPLFLGTEPLPSVFYWLCMLMGLGFLVAATGVIRSARAGRRQAAASSPPSAPSAT
ncbi:hypothetical protein San01_39170 [Streptomyces angustmyceticus]|uniref:Integral membrane protein n=2 Tax=Streptomyces angustmyceticus TaxID=285578 RepID=A0A5J4LIL8_9ACTN|nr:hypothetical protein San01_39170 [Streptomyces angustmyceticus]